MRKITRTLGELAHLVKGRVVGDPLCQISGLATLESAQAGDLSFFHNAKYRIPLESTKASAVILKEEALSFCPSSALVVADPYFAYAKIAELWKEEPLMEGVHPRAVIGQNVQLGKNVVIGPGVVIEDHVVIGEDTRIDANAVIYHHVHIGSRVRIYAGAIIGADGFGNAFHEGRWQAVPQLGSVRIGDDVSIGANTTIDRGAIEDTVIGHGVRLDNLIQIGHNVEIGDHTAIAAGAMIAGSVKIGRYCMIGGSTKMKGHIRIADRTILTGGTEVGASIREPGQMYSSGMGAFKNSEWLRMVVRLRHLDDMATRLRKLENQREEKS